MRFPTVVVRGDVLQSWLTVSDYSRSQLANELGVSKGRISQLLTSREEPSAHLVAKLITLTELPFDRLFRIVRDSSLIHPVLLKKLIRRNGSRDLSRSRIHSKNGNHRNGHRRNGSASIRRSSSR